MMVDARPVRIAPSANHNIEELRTIPHKKLAGTLGLFITLCHVVPLLGALIAVLIIPLWSPKPHTLIVAFIMWFLSMGIGITVGYHRLFSHRSFQTYQPIRILIAICGSMAGQGPLIAWVALHRCHHNFSDLTGDPHSPWPHDDNIPSKIKALWHAHFGWVMQYNIPDPLHYCPDLIKNKAISLTSRMFLLWYLIGLLVPALIVGLIDWSWNGITEGFLWAGCFRVAISSQITWCINSICHFFGSRPYDTHDHSSNVALLAIPSLGEAWHNNHHAFPNSAMFGINWWQVDIGYRFITLLKVFRLAWDIQLPKTTLKRSHDTQPKTN